MEHYSNGYHAGLAMQEFPGLKPLGDSKVSPGFDLTF